MNYIGLKLNRTYRLLFYADDVNSLGDSTSSIKENTESVVHAINELNIQVSTEETKHIFIYVSSYTAGKNHSIS
jgi:hypothetical protein